MRLTNYFIKKKVQSLASGAAGRKHEFCALEADASCIPVHAKKDVNVWQVPSDVVLERFKTVKADILIDLTRPDCYPMQYLMLQHPCRFKVGVKHADIDLYDLSISVTEREDIKHLFEHILFYLQAIRSK